MWQLTFGAALDLECFALGAGIFHEEVHDGAKRGFVVALGCFMFFLGYQYNEEEEYGSV